MAVNVGLKFQPNILTKENHLEWKQDNFLFIVQAGPTKELVSLPWLGRLKAISKSK